MLSRVSEVFGQLHPTGAKIDVTVGGRELVLHASEMTWVSRMGPNDDQDEIENHVLELARGHTRAFTVNGRSLTRRTSARNVSVAGTRQA